MGLTAEEKRLLKELNRKSEEPDEPPVGRSVNVTVDLSDPKQVATAIKMGFLRAIGADDDDEDDDDDDEKVNENPRGRGYFKD